MKALSAILVLPCVLLLFAGGQAPPIAETDDLAELGKFLFFDTRLSGDGSISCASCHDPERAWTDGESLSRSYPGSNGFRNTKSVLNTADKPSFYWDGRLDGSDLETMIRDHITETHFMNLDGRLMLERLKQVPFYVEQFQTSLGQEPSFGGTLKAIAAFQRTLVSGPSPFDTGNLSAASSRGQALFEGKAGCAGCHSGPQFTDHLPHRINVPENPALFGEPLRHATYRSFIKFMGVPGYMNIQKDVGRFTVSKEESDLGAFVTPGLRQVAETAPYMHNGIFKTLDEVVAFYAERGPSLTDNEQSDLVSFLRDLSGPTPEVLAPDIPPYEVITDWETSRN